uniref:Tes115 n=1 Tax=Loa loa TaxID=7209 RepID=A0A1I7VD39_LOALO
MDSHYSCRQRRFRPHSPIPQESNPIYRSSELDYSISGTGAGGGGPGHFGSEKQPRRSRSLENRRDWLFTDDYGFPVMGTDERFNGASKRYQCQQQRNYHYQPYLSINTGPATGYRGTYDGRRGNEHYFDNFVTLQSNPTESDWDALDRSIRNYRENPNGEQMAVTVRRSKAQSLSPVRPSHGGIGGTLGGTKSRRHNLPSYFYRHSGTVGGFAGSQSVSLSIEMNQYGVPETIFPVVQRYKMSHQQPDYYGPGVGPANVTSAMRDRAIIRGTTADTTRYGFGAQKYYKFHCCCLSFRWPPWAFEEVEPPQPIYRRT